MFINQTHIYLRHRKEFDRSTATPTCNSPPTLPGVGHQCTVMSTNIACNQWLSLAKPTPKVPPLLVGIVHGWPAPVSARGCNLQYQYSLACHLLVAWLLTYNIYYIHMHPSIHPPIHPKPSKSQTLTESEHEHVSSARLKLIPRGTR